MRVPGRVFADEALFQAAVRDKAVDQVANVATLPGIVGYSFGMPDIHWGYGFPVGGVAATDVNAGGVVSPGGVGFDICCGVRLIRSDLTRDEVAPKLATLASLMGARIPRGVGKDGLLSLDRRGLTEVLRDGVVAALRLGIGWEEDAERCEDGGRTPGADPSVVSDRAYERGAPQCGSLGAGNHFIEVQFVDRIEDSAIAEAFGLFEGGVCVMMHTGSRGLGHQVCTDELKVFDRLMRASGIEVPDRQLACGPVESPDAQRYLGAMAAAANFARTNRHVLGDAVRACFAQVFGRDAAELGMDLVYDVAHNMAKIERYTINGADKTLCVHRKGATRAFGPGHPDLPMRYRNAGQPVIIPGSMGTASYVLAGTAEGRDRSFWSTCHGAGRTMSRTQARKKQSGRELAEELARAGILVEVTQWGLLAEEAPYAYKEVSTIVDICEGAGLSKKVARLRPLAVVKG